MTEQVKSLVHTYLQEGWHTFFFDGSSKRYEWICGGVWLLLSW